jgi:hypothetical protein
MLIAIAFLKEQSAEISYIWAGDTRHGDRQMRLLYYEYLPARHKTTSFKFTSCDELLKASRHMT